jgi:glycosyltransferase involved in cell wall biosynthesis
VVITKPAVSVIVPTYCEEEHVEQCLKSIRRQNLKQGKIEIIVVDSNSPDNTTAIAKKLADKVINIKDRGVSKARNTGAQKAKGGLLIFLDADTILGPGFIASMYECFADSNVVYASGELLGLDPTGIMGSLFKFFHYGLVNKAATFTARLGFPLFPTVCCACRKSAFLRVKGFDERLAVAEDLRFSLGIGRVGKCLVNRKAKAYTSLRRAVKHGRMKNYFIYFRNYFRVFVLHKKPWIHDFPHTMEH